MHSNSIHRVPKSGHAVKLKYQHAEMNYAPQDTSSDGAKPGLNGDWLPSPNQPSRESVEPEAPSEDASPLENARHATTLSPIQPSLLAAKERKESPPALCVLCDLSRPNPVTPYHPPHPTPPALPTSPTKVFREIPCLPWSTVSCLIAEPTEFHGNSIQLGAFNITRISTRKQAGKDCLLQANWLCYTVSQTALGGKELSR